MTTAAVGSVPVRGSTASVRSRHHGRHVAPKRRRANPLVSVLFVLAGVGVMLYPVMATHFNNVRQREFAANYQASVQGASQDQLADQLRSADAYNQTLAGTPILDPYLGKLVRPPESDSYRSYTAQLAGFGMMGRLRIPGIGVDLPMYHGTTDEVLAKGIGHLYGTALPVGGVGRHTVLTSHTGLPNATLLDHLIDMREGDRFYLDVAGQTLAYQVDQIKVVLPHEISDLKAVPGADLATLFTCTPYAVNSHRLLVRGHRVPVDLATEPHALAPTSAGPAWTFESWMYWLIAAAAASLLTLVVLIVLGRRRRDRERERRRRRRQLAMAADPPTM